MDTDAQLVRDNVPTDISERLQALIAATVERTIAGILENTDVGKRRRDHSGSRSRGRRSRSGSRGRRSRSGSRGKRSRSNSRDKDDGSRSGNRHNRCRSRGKRDRSRSGSRERRLDWDSFDAFPRRRHHHHHFHRHSSSWYGEFDFHPRHHGWGGFGRRGHPPTETNVENKEGNNEEAEQGVPAAEKNLNRNLQSLVIEDNF